MKKVIFLIGFFTLSFLRAQQLTYLDAAILENSDTLKFGMAGGLNAPQFSEIDLNNDGIKDLLVFDRAAQVALTFLNNGQQISNPYTFAPEFMNRFPQNCRNFMLARDYDCDGIEDLFHFNQPPLTAGGIAVLKGSYDSENKIIFNEVSPILKYTSTFGLNDIFIFNPDVPGIEDVDGDGDLDIVAFSLDFIFNRNIWFYRNLSSESGFGCDSLIFNLEHQCHGMATETISNNNTYFLSPGVDSCADNPYWPQRPGGPRHSGSSVTLVDWNKDGAMDLLVGDVSVNSLNMLTAAIVNDTIIFVSQDSLYPSYDTPVNLFSFPSAYFVDVNNDGNKDMLACVTELAVGEAVTDSVVWLYENTNTDSFNLNFIQKNFFVEEMVDLGRASNVAIVDVNGDELLDLVIGHFAYTDTFQNYTTGLAYYENIGSFTAPSFRLVSRDFGGFSTLNVRGLFPNFGDIDNDGDMDLIMGVQDGSLILVENIAGAGNPMTWGSIQSNYKGINVNDFSAPQFVDIDRDGDLDLMVGDYIGQLHFFENTGTPTLPSFSSTPTNNTFGFDLGSYGSGNAAPHFYDNNGSYELFLGHELGGIIHLGSIDGNITGIYDTLNLNFGNIFTGRFSNVAIADFDGNDTLDYLVGNMRGGFSILTFKSIDSTLVPIQNFEDKNEVKVYPNPAKDFINISLSEATENLQISIFDALGRLSHSQKTVNKNQNFTMKIDKLSKGIYFIEIKSEKLRSVHKLMVE